MPADAQQRSRALDLDNSWIVQAPAGSGKTELLTQRFLKLLCRVDRPERILAITFTRKATQEMRERIMLRMRQAAGGVSVERDHEKLAVDLARVVLARGAELGWDLLMNPGRLRIYTIDGLCSQLLARDPLRGAQVTGLRILDDSGRLYRAAIRRLFEDLGPGGAMEGQHDALVRLLVHLDGNTQALQDLLVSMLGIRDQWSRQMHHGLLTMRDVLLDRQRRELRRFREALGADSLDEAEAIVTRLGRAGEDRESPAARLAMEMDKDQNDAESGIARAYWLAQLITTNADSPRAPGGISKRLFPGLPAELEELPAALKAIYAGWHASPAAKGAIQRMARTPPLDGVEPQEQLLEDIRAVLFLALAELRVIIAERGEADFQFMSEMALQSLGDELEPGHVLLAEDQRLEHVLMDEFQDTSYTQYELLGKLTTGWQAGDGRSLFLVGDPMQSIYRFREANVGLFIEVMASGLVGHVPLGVLKLESNFRSDWNVVQWVNEHFERIFPDRHEGDSGAVSYTHFHPEHAGSGGVFAHPLQPGHTDQDEAAAIIAVIEEARRNLDQPRIAVLGRTRKHLEALARTLVRRGIPFEAVQIDPLISRPVVRDLEAITRALCHPGDRIAWLSLMRAPWCGLDVRALHEVAGDQADFELLKRLGEFLASGAPAGGRTERLQHLFEVMSRAMRQRGRQSLRELVEHVWLQLGGPYCYASAAELENAASFLAALDEVEREGSEELPERLHEALENLYAGSRPSRLQLMTIHKAKGLEFDVVILPGLHRVPRQGDKPLVSLQEFRLEDGHSAVLMAPVIPRGQKQPSVYSYLNAVDHERAAFETQRLLYVAATRAKHQLHLFGRFRRNKDGELYAPKNTFLDMLQPAFIDTIANTPKLERHEEPENPRPQALPLLRLHNEPALGIPVEEKPHSESLLPQSLPERDAVALGGALHYWLELMHDHFHDHGARGWDPGWFDGNEGALESTLRRSGAPEKSIPILLLQLKEMLVDAISAGSGREMVSPEGKQGSWTELVLFKREGNQASRHIIDRLYRDQDGKLVIVDYKSGEDNELARGKWREQLARYRQLMNGLDSGEVSGTLIHQTSDNTIIDLSRETEQV